MTLIIAKWSEKWTKGCNLLFHTIMLKCSTFYWSYQSSLNEYQALVPNYAKFYNFLAVIVVHHFPMLQHGEIELRNDRDPNDVEIKQYQDVSCFASLLTIQRYNITLTISICKTIFTSHFNQFVHIKLLWLSQ